MNVTQTQHYTREHSIRNGIEWISYIPQQRQHSTPILMQHGMWHGAWCWQPWQEALAEWGWESHAISLPGHAGSPVQRPIRLCTLDYYLKFLRAALESLPQTPILMGHSMGGALTQWYLRDVGNLPAAVLIGAWALYGGFWRCLPAFLRLDLPGTILSGLVLRSEWVRNPQRAAAALLSPDSLMTPEELFAQLGPESLLVIFQHLRPWRVPASFNTPMLWLAAERDTLIPEHASRIAASVYPDAQYVMVPGAAHNIMMEANYREIAHQIHEWLARTLPD